MDAETHPGGRGRVPRAVLRQPPPNIQVATSKQSPTTAGGPNILAKVIAAGGVYPPNFLPPTTVVFQPLALPPVVLARRRTQQRLPPPRVAAARPRASIVPCVLPTLSIQSPRGLVRGAPVSGELEADGELATGRQALGAAARRRRRPRSRGKLAV